MEAAVPNRPPGFCPNAGAVCGVELAPVVADAFPAPKSPPVGAGVDDPVPNRAPETDAEVAVFAPNNPPEGAAGVVEGVDDPPKRFAAGLD